LSAAPSAWRAGISAAISSAHRFPASTFGEIGKRAAALYLVDEPRISQAGKLAGLLRVFG